MYQAPRGTADILPEDQPYWRYIEQKAAEITRLYGYQRIDTPVFEDTGLFTRGVGEETDIVQKEMYTFEDRGGNKSDPAAGRNRPDLPGLSGTRHAEPAPAGQTVLYWLPATATKGPRPARYREFHQFGCEAIGEIDPPWMPK